MTDLATTQDSLNFQSDSPNYSGTKARALELLGDGIASNIVAQTLGVSESYISQLLSDELFLKGVVEKRYEHLARHNKRDAEYDKIEDDLLERLKATLPMLFDPMKILKAISVINAAKRRGQSTPESISQQNVVVNLTLPTAVIEKFSVTKDINNQIIEAGEQKLITIQSGNLLERVKKSGVNNGEQPTGINSSSTQTPAIRG